MDTYFTLKLIVNEPTEFTYSFGPYIESVEAISVMMDHIELLYLLASVPEASSGQLVLEECFLRDNQPVSLGHKIERDWNRE